MAELNELNLKETFQHAFNTFKMIERNDMPGNPTEIQDSICESIDCFRKAIEMINDLVLFSNNEELDEVSTTNLRYLLVPALLGELYLKLRFDNRLEVVMMSKVYFLNFLERCKMYHLIKQDGDANIQSAVTSCINVKKSLEELAIERQAKIKRYKRMKEQEKQINEISNALESWSGSNEEEEIQRKLTIVLLENWIDRSFENLSAINSEMQILEHMAKMKEIDSTTLKTDVLEEKEKKLFSRPVLITRQIIQNKVFGPGYPSLPTMTQEEYFEKELREGKIVTEYSDKSKQMESENSKDFEKNTTDDAEDEEYLKKLAKDREWDDWKDDHRRGWGNRANTG
ncbi:immunoglobulin-binding protein 1-like [Xenia sp. Carnegie-2017]|uniref:immunoglobulin-binding protein 1-like n=1 Tax=Xenia sp. Carnegie-2017 TaxID=2897299 RepID=UPI001F04598F|nr:immunoglobulin-binding protein 1-like [Xenia sp. Carnegie-2017]